MRSEYSWVFCLLVIEALIGFMFFGLLGEDIRNTYFPLILWSMAGIAVVFAVAVGVHRWFKHWHRQQQWNKRYGNNG